MNTVASALATLSVTSTATDVTAATATLLLLLVEALMRLLYLVAGAATVASLHTTEIGMQLHVPLTKTPIGNTATATSATASASATSADRPFIGQ